jgi:hypothetical protein
MFAARRPLVETFTTEKATVALAERVMPVVAASLLGGQRPGGTGRRRRALAGRFSRRGCHHAPPQWGRAQARPRPSHRVALTSDFIPRHSLDPSPTGPSRQPTGDGLVALLGSVLRAAGRQSLGAALNLLGYWVVGLPIALALGFPLQMGVVGMWVGLASCAAVQVGRLWCGWGRVRGLSARRWQVMWAQ